MAEHANKTATQAVWDGIAVGDYTAALEGPQAERLQMWHGPGAGPFAGYNEGGEKNLEMLLFFNDVFGGTWNQKGTCVYADDRCSISLVHETGETPDGAVFDNMAIWIGRFDANGATDALWTVDLDMESVTEFWRSRQ